MKMTKNWNCFKFGIGYITVV